MNKLTARLQLEPQQRQSKTNGAGSAAGADQLIARLASGIEPERVDWLWPGRLARGKHACFAGEPGTGKSQLSIAIVAAVTVGAEWPCCEGRAPRGNVIILSAEDGAADTILPRLMAVGADLDRVCLVSAVRKFGGKGQRTFNLQTDIELLEAKIAQLGDVALVVVDPVSSYLGETDSHRNSEVRGVLEPLSEMAERTRVGVLTITHFSKAGAANTTKALHRFIGSIAFIGAPRTAFAVIEDADHDGRYLLLHAKNNLAAPPQGLAYRLEQTMIGDGIVAPRVAWEGEPVSITANQALAAEAAGGDRPARRRAEELLRDLLAGGPVPQKEIKEAAEGNGLAWATVRRAKDRLGAKAERQSEEGTKRGRGQWVWSLQGARVQGAHSRCSVDVRDFEHLEEYRADQGVVLLQDAQNVQEAHISKLSTLNEGEAVHDTKARPVCEQCGQPDAEEKAYYGEASAWLHRACEDAWRAACDLDDLTIPYLAITDA